MLFLLKLPPTERPAPGHPAPFTRSPNSWSRLSDHALNSSHQRGQMLSDPGIILPHYA